VCFGVKERSFAFACLPLEIMHSTLTNRSLPDDDHEPAILRCRQCLDGTANAGESRLYQHNAERFAEYCDQLQNDSDQNKIDLPIRCNGNANSHHSHVERCLVTVSACFYNAAHQEDSNWHCSLEHLYERDGQVQIAGIS
jgi:hypothetical protein